jgi:hypothetical protein
MKRYSTLLWSDRADAPVARGDYDTARFALLAELGHISDWSPPSLAVDGTPTDYLANELGIRLCSAKLRDLIESARAEADELQWLDAVVHDDSGSHISYFVPHFPSALDVLDPDETLFAPDGSTVVRPAISLARADSHVVFSYSPFGVAMVVAAELRRAIVAAGCTGVYFGSIRQV